MNDKIATLVVPSNEITDGSIVRLKSGSPAMTVSKLRTVAICSFYDPNTSSFIENEFFVHELEIDPKKIDQNKFNIVI